MNNLRKAIVAQTKPAPAAVAREGNFFHVLSAPGATVEQVRGWVSAAWPYARRRLWTEQDSAADTGGSLDASLGMMRESLGVQLEVHDRDAGFLHDIAQRATLPVLVLDGETFDGEAPFLAFTEYTPGQAPQTRWFDPLRPTAEPVPRSWLMRAFGYSGDVKDFALHAYGETDVSAVLTLEVWREAGRLPEMPVWADHRGEEQEEAELVVPPKFDRVTDTVHEEQEEAEFAVAPKFDRGMDAVGATLSLVLLGAISLSLPILFFMLGDSRTLEWAAVSAVGAQVFGGWLAVVPLKWPQGPRIPLRWRLAWFLGVPVLVPFALWLGGA